MPRSKSRKNKGGSSSGGSRGGGAMSGLRSGTKRIAGTSGAKKKKRPRTFWDMLFWIAAGGAVLYLLLQRLG